MKTILTVTRWNLGVLAGWFAVPLGVVGLALHVYLDLDNQYGSLWFGVVGVFFGGLTITFGGPIKTITEKVVDLKPVDANGTE